MIIFVRDGGCSVHYILVAIFYGYEVMMVIYDEIYDHIIMMR